MENTRRSGVPYRPAVGTKQDTTLMMIEIPIKQVVTKTVGDLEATIDALSPTSTDCLVGTLKTANGVKEVSWDKNGICRDHSPDCNLDMDVNEHIHAASVAGALNDQFEAQMRKRDQG